MSFSQVEIPPKSEFIGPAVQFISKYAAELGVNEEGRNNLSLVLEKGISILVEHNRDGESAERVGIKVEKSDHSLNVELLNRGVPLYLKENNPLHSQFNDLSRKLDSLQIENRGRDGQAIILKVELKEEVPFIKTLNKEKESQCLDSTGIEVRELKAGEEAKLSELFYHVYGYRYINDYIYYPEKIAKLIKEKSLLSFVGVLPNGEFVGHVGLLKWNDTPPVYEPCLGVVDKRVKSRGLFGSLFQAMMDKANEIQMQYLFFDFVTNHDYSQRFVSKFGLVELALLVGCQSKETQAKLEKLGLGEDPKEMDRYSLLYGIIPQTKFPFGKEVSLPNNLGEMLGFLLKPLNIQWTPAPRFQLLKSDGQYTTNIQPAQNAVVFDFLDPGKSAVNQILSDWRQLLRSGYQYCGIDVPVDSPGLGHLYDLLSEHGFFVAGFMPYRHSAKLAMRFQSIGPTKVAFDDIKVCSETSKKLLHLVRANYERNGLL